MNLFHTESKSKKTHNCFFGGGGVGGVGWLVVLGLAAL